MKSRNLPDRVIPLGLSLLPGMGHLALGKRSRGLPLLALTLLLVLVLYSGMSAGTIISRSAHFVTMSTHLL